MAEIESIKPRAFQLAESNMQLLEQIKSELGAATWNEVFTNILQRFYDPIKINSKNNEELKNLQAVNSDLKEQLRVKIDYVKNLKSDLDDMCNRFSQQSAELDNLKNSKHINDNQMLLDIDKVNQLVLKEVAKREGERRNQNWTPSDVVNYFIESRFVNGDLNGNLKSLPDSVIEKLRKECENVND